LLALFVCSALRSTKHEFSFRSLGGYGKKLLGLDGTICLLAFREKFPDPFGSLQLTMQL